MSERVNESPRRFLQGLRSFAITPVMKKSTQNILIGNLSCRAQPLGPAVGAVGWHIWPAFSLSCSLPQGHLSIRYSGHRLGP